MTKDEQNRIIQKLDSMGEKIMDIDKTLIRQETILENHIRRTELNEQRIEEFQRFQYKLVGAFVTIQIAVPILLKIFG